MKTSTIISIGLIAIVLALVLGYVAFVKPKLGEQVQAPEVNNNLVDTVPTIDDISTPTPAPDDNSEIDTADWEVYRNEKYGYEIKYPKDWEYKIQESGYGLEKNYDINFIDSKNQDKLIFFDSSPALSFKKDANGFIQKYFETRELKIESKKNIVIDGVAGVKHIGDYNDLTNKKHIIAYWSNKLTEENDFYILETYIKTEDKNDKASEEMIINIFNQMLSTFKFTEPSIDISSWKTYWNEEYNFEVKYPKHWVIGSPAYIGNASRSGNTYHILGMTPYAFEGDWSILISVTPQPIDEILEDDNYYWNKGWDIENKENILINNIPAQKVTWSNSAIIIYFQKPDKSITVEFGGDAKKLPAISDILFTFKFIK